MFYQKKSNICTSKDTLVFQKSLLSVKSHFCTEPENHNYSWKRHFCFTKSHFCSQLERDSGIQVTSLSKKSLLYRTRKPQLQLKKTLNFLPKVTSVRHLYGILEFRDPGGKHNLGFQGIPAVPLKKRCGFCLVSRQKSGSQLGICTPRSPSLSFLYK